MIVLTGIGPVILLNSAIKKVGRIKKSEPDKIAGLTGDLTNMETLYSIKEFFNTTIKSKNLDSRSDFFCINTENRKNGSGPVKGKLFKCDLCTYANQRERYLHLFILRRMLKQ